MSSQKLVIIIAVIVVMVAVASAYTLLPSHVIVRIATTTSLYATGLLDYLAEQFEKENPGAKLEFIAAGTGAALKYAERGDACAVLVHAPSLEREYIEKGVFEAGLIFAYNYFIIVGPKDDPAGISGSDSAIEAFKRIYSAGESGEAIFVSRGDLSGTHLREMAIWRKAGIDPAGKSWYKEAAAGMEQTLIIANELLAYSLSDAGTYLKFKREGRLSAFEALYANPEDLETINIYSVYVARGCFGDERRYTELFLKYLRDRQDVLRSFCENEYGLPLFYPAEGRLKELRNLWSRLASSQG